MKITPKSSQYYRNVGEFPSNYSCSQDWVICRGKQVSCEITLGGRSESTYLPYIGQIKVQGLE